MVRSKLVNKTVPTLASLSIPAEQAECVGTLTGTYNSPALSDQEIFDALTRPIWADANRPPVFDLIKPGESVCVVVSDHTRKTAADRVLPAFLRGLSKTLKRSKSLPARGCFENMFILVASGIHRHPTADELKIILGPDIVKAFKGRVFFHDPDDDQNLVSIGTTRRGHEVRINRRAVEADHLILIGTAMYHYHAGFGGGRKSLVPGLAGRSTISHTHSLTLDPEHDQIHPKAFIGNLEDNPVSEEMLESVRLYPPDFIINTVLSPDGTLAGVFAGDLDLAHRAACQLVELIDRISIKKTADFVIAWAGSASNWIQSHKALFNASRAIGPKGRIILVAPCPEGLGNERFRYWITRNTIKEIYQGLRQSPEVLGQTALSTRARGSRAILVTDMNMKDIADLGIRTEPDLDSAISAVLKDFRQIGTNRPSYYLMPHALSLVPFIDGHAKQLPCD